tara:strand:+ start:11844 stop:12101 length:258 start_codon:yes stop_codon:yes gene_type:complete
MLLVIVVRKKYFSINSFSRLALKGVLKCSKAAIIALLRLQLAERRRLRSKSLIASTDLPLIALRSLKYYEIIKNVNGYSKALGVF